MYDALPPSFSSHLDRAPDRLPRRGWSVPQPSISVILFFFIRKWTPRTMPALTFRERSWVGPKAMVASPWIPNTSFSRVSTCASSALRSSALEGMQPTLRQTPPQYFFSTTATDLPSWAARMAATYPPGPAPRTTTSKCPGVEDWACC